MRLISELTPSNPYINLAIEEVLNQIPIHEPIVRFWVNKPSVILGRFDELLKEVNVGYCIDNGISIARRHSGGGTVYHDEGNLNITLVFPRTYYSDLMTCYEVLAKLIILALDSLGVKANFMKPNEVLVNGLKVSGMAGSLTKYSLQCHSTLLVSSDLIKLRRALRRLKREVTTLSKEVGWDLSLVEASKAVVEVLSSSYDLVLSNLSDYELRMAQELCSSKYSTIAWIYCR